MMDGNALMIIPQPGGGGPVPALVAVAGEHAFMHS